MNAKRRKGQYSALFVTAFIGILKRRIKKTRHRGYVLNEWLTTEIKYHSDIDLAIKHIKEPMLKS